IATNSIHLHDLKDIDSSFKQYLKFGLALFSCLKEFYKTTILEVKQLILGSIFPQNLIFDENKYRTTYLNETFARIAKNISQLQNHKNKKAVKNDDLSDIAPPPGLEPGTL